MSTKAAADHQPADAPPPDTPASSSASASAKAPAVPAAGRVRADTLIADVVDYPLELYARERTAAFATNPNQTGVPAVVAVALVLAFVAVIVLLGWQMTVGVGQGPPGWAVTVGIVAFIGLAVIAMQLRGMRVGAVDPEAAARLTALDMQIRERFQKLGIACHGCAAAYGETFEQGAKIHKYDLETVLTSINELGLDLRKTRQPNTPASPPTGADA